MHSTRLRPVAPSVEPDLHRLHLVVSRAAGDYLRVLERLAIAGVAPRRVRVEVRDADAFDVRLELACDAATFARLEGRLRTLPQVRGDDP